MLVFVYGTLKRGGCRHHLLGVPEWVGEAVTEARFRLYDCGEYPAMVESSKGLKVRGELWRVSPQRLPLLDQEEGVAEGLYDRRSIEVSSGGRKYEAQTYIYCRPVLGLRDLGASWSLPG